MKIEESWIADRDRWNEDEGGLARAAPNAQRQSTLTLTHEREREHEEAAAVLCFVVSLLLHHHLSCSCALIYSYSLANPRCLSRTDPLSIVSFESQSRVWIR